MKRLIAAISFFSFYLLDVLRSNVRVAADVLTPKHYMEPGVIAVNIQGMTDRQVMFMANFITMTPGTLGIAISDNRETLYIHAMYLTGNGDSVAEELENTYGKRIRDVF